MPLIENPLPSLLTTIGGPNPPSRPYLIFYASADENGRMWCGDCRDVEGLVKETFGSPDGPTGIIFDVGDKPTWRNPKNEYKQEYKISSIPTIIRIDEGTGREIGRIVESDILNASKFAAFMK